MPARPPLLAVWGENDPFFWLGDTWWMGLTKRLRWPEDFEALTNDRVQKGFTVVQIVAGLYPDMPSFDERGFNEAGSAWDKDFSRINPWLEKAGGLRRGRVGDAECLLVDAAIFQTQVVARLLLSPAGRSSRCPVP